MAVARTVSSTSVAPSAARNDASVGWHDRGIPYYIDGHGITVASMLAMLTGVLLFALGLICDQVAQLRLERYE